METKIQLVLDYIHEMKECRINSIDRISKAGIHSYSEAFSYGYDKGSLSDLEFIESLLQNF